MTTLDQLGCRICIIGPSSNGKSTLAQALGSKLDLTVCHLDQMAHIPNTNWKPRTKDLLQKDHQAFLTHHEKWIIEGNYSYLMKERFEKATAIIWLDFNVFGSLIRYFKRTAKNSDTRPGNLPGATQQFSWDHLHYMVFDAPKKRHRYQLLTEESKVYTLRLTSFQELIGYYEFWNLWS